MKKRRIHERTPQARVAIKPAPEGLPDAKGWRVFPSNSAFFPQSPFVARAQFPGFAKPVERRFRDFASAKAWADAENEKLAALDPKRAELLLTSRELAERLNISADSLFGLRTRGLPFVKVSCHDYRYYWSEVRAWLDAPREESQPPPKPFVVEPCKDGGYKFRVRGTGEFSSESKPFTSEKKAIAYAATRNRAVGLRPNKPIPRRPRGAADDAPFCTVAPLTLKARPDIRYRAYVLFVGQKHAKEWLFRTEAEALHFANRKNLEFARDEARREVEQLPTLPEVEKGKLGVIPPVQWTEAQMQGIDSGHGLRNPVKGPPFRIHPTKQNDYSFVVRGPTTGRGKASRTFFKTEREAKTYAHMRNTEAREQGLESLSFPAWLRVTAQSCHARLSARGKTLEDATRHFLEYLDRTEKSITLAELAKRILATKKNAGLSKDWQYILKRTLEKFTAAIGAETIVSEITSDQIAEYLATVPGKASTRNSVRRTLSGLFAYAIEKEFLSKNPVRATEKEKEIAPPVGILTPPQLAALLAAAPAAWVPFLAIGAFAGLRVAELLRLDWAQVDLVDGFVEVTARNAKSARRRLVKILPALDAFIRPFAKQFGRVAPCNGFIPSSHIPETLQAAGITEWPRNALRHSFASYHIAHFRDAAALALEMGHTTTGLIFHHYRQVVRQAESERWWVLRPSPESAAGKVVAMTGEAAIPAQSAG